VDAPDAAHLQAERYSFLMWQPPFISITNSTPVPYQISVDFHINYVYQPLLSNSFVASLSDGAEMKGDPLSKPGVDLSQARRQLVSLQGIISQARDFGSDIWNTHGAYISKAFKKALRDLGPSMADMVLPGSGMIVNHFLQARALYADPMSHETLAFYVEDCFRVLSKLEDGNALGTIKQAMLDFMQVPSLESQTTEALDDTRDSILQDIPESKQEEEGSK